MQLNGGFELKPPVEGSLQNLGIVNGHGLEIRVTPSAARLERLQGRLFVKQLLLSVSNSCRGFPARYDARLVTHTATVTDRISHTHKPKASSILDAQSALPPLNRPLSSPLPPSPGPHSPVQRRGTEVIQRPSGVTSPKSD
ncbi:hypothetical protein PoB_005014900 [Plakobranchus ocellatus]|uniref:Uncharacterized protein n=1 Tax=Plakobranchus ocellatus TaxID=259542 RepID=A0AAV4BTY4_9GAST|nr:hypothetical protein PoB_005014900 [Plakobranchus ocellatus]